jgi:hypothetical protein
MAAYFSVELDEKTSAKLQELKGKALAWIEEEKKPKTEKKKSEKSIRLQKQQSREEKDKDKEKILVHLENEEKSETQITNDMKKIEIKGTTVKTDTKDTNDNNHISEGINDKKNVVNNTLEKPDGTKSEDKSENCENNKNNKNNKDDKDNNKDNKDANTKETKSQNEIEFELSLLRFLRARKFEVEPAFQMYCKAMLWRRQHNVDMILDNEDPAEEVYQRICPHKHHKFDKLGHPIYLERTGLVKMPVLTKHVTEHDLVVRHIRSIEQIVGRMKESSILRGKNVDKQVVIMDLKGLSFRPDAVGMRVFKETLNIDQQYYPERLHHLFLINAPWIFSSVWAIIKLWLDPVTKTKIEVLGGNYKHRLLEFIDADSLPEEYGGTCKCSGSCLSELKPYTGPLVAGSSGSTYMSRPVEAG